MGWVAMRSDHQRLRMIASREDESAGMVLLTLTIGAVLSLSAIVFELGQIPHLSPDQRALRYGFTALTVGGSWMLVGVLFCFHYAHMFYRSPATKLPLRFPDELKEPDYWDFLYFSFVVGMTCQVSDVQATSGAMRRLILAHGVFTFFFNAGVLALAVNILATAL